jgi:hypothetical protein
VVGQCFIFTTAEVVLGTSNEIEFTRAMDERTGFPELLPKDRTVRYCGMELKTTDLFNCLKRPL